MNGLQSETSNREDWCPSYRPAIFFTITVNSFEKNQTTVCVKSKPAPATSTTYLQYWCCGTGEDGAKMVDTRC